MRIIAAVLIAVCVAACHSGSSDGGRDPDADRDGFAASTDCNDNDALAWQTISVFRDADLDNIGAGSTVSACAGNLPPPGFALTSTDCNDNDALTWQTISVFSDIDLDGVGTGQAVSMCTGNFTPVGFALTSTDCAVNDPARHTLMSYAARDADGDTVVIASAGSICGDGTTLPATYFASVGSAPTDCDDQNASAWRLANLHEDFDRDGVGHGPLLSVCTGDGGPPGFADSSSDCDDLNATKWRMVALYSDMDGDGVGSGAIQPLCVGSGSPPGSSFLGFDPLDTLTDPDSDVVSDFDLDIPRLIVESETDDDDVL